MTTPVRWLLIVIGVAGILISSTSLLSLFTVIRQNGLTNGEPVGLRDHYIQIGNFYSRGFTTGFFLCFSLMLVAIAVGTWYEERRKARGLEAAASSGARAALRSLPPSIAEN